MIPSSVAGAIKKLQMKFLWDQWKESKGMHLIAWKEVCAPKESGGLRVKISEVANKALLSKWLWRFGHEEGSF